MFRVLLLLLSLVVVACHSAGTGENRVVGDSVSVDLEAWKAAGLPKTEKVTVRKDPVFHMRKRFEAVPVEDVLERIPLYASTKPDELEVVFECEDGYHPTMPLPLLLKSKAWLGVRDLDAPAGQEWTTLQKGAETKKIAPFYLFYTNVSGDDPAYKWPYNLVRIRLVKNAERREALLPDSTAAKGYALFKLHCQTCHSVNGLGGTLGPELNRPRSVTEYWKEDELKAFIANPASFRDRVKMPQLALEKEEIEEIVGYLRYMRGRR